MKLPKDPSPRIGGLLAAGLRSARREPASPEISIGRARFIAAAWSATRARPNLGDSMAGFLLTKILGMPIVQVPMRSRPKLLSIGSVFDHALPGDICWGTGTMLNKEVVAEGVKVLAVRGPRTARLIRGTEVPKIFGDPAVLLPEIFTPQPSQPVKLALVPHYVDYEFIRGHVNNDPSVRVVDVAKMNWKSTVSEITSAEIVISSSLHGIVVAEAYGIPALWVRISDKVGGGIHKFLDYYESTQRYASPVEWRDSTIGELPYLNPPSREGVPELAAALTTHFWQS